MVRAIRKDGSKRKNLLHKCRAVANTYFQFKQFTIWQQHCAMKVCTDACIFGAFAAKELSRGKYRAHTILDIGTGTGLLSLMIAQKTDAAIDAVEIEESAFLQAADNFGRSPWSKRLTIANADVLLFEPSKKYDCIISNPPFFEADLRSNNTKKNAARHNTTLTLEQLLEVTDRHLSPGGYFAVLLPYHRQVFFTEIASAAGYYLHEQLLVRHSEVHPFSRCILFFSHQETTANNQEMSVKNNEGTYTGEFTALLEDYYLHL